ncbi:metallophosphoesterase [Spirulina sp. CCNP1310]|nr:metallophosphoesterase [Spirulina sp. CCNP1310]MEA5418758.1 metallophosphoesterase [Spirulina sp. CCNP1310]
MKRRQLFTFLASLTGFTVAACLPRTQAHSVNIAALPENIQGEPLLRFVSLGDFGTGSSAQYNLGQAMADYHRQFPYHLALTVGDNIYNEGEIEKIQRVFEIPYGELLRRGVKFRATLGNHDIRTENGDPQVAYPGFNMDGRYYSYTAGPAQFFALDTNGNADWEPQLAWLDRELAASTAPWKIVYGHHNIYTSGHYGVNQARWAQILKTFFKRYGVQLYLNGHDHHYERTIPIEGTTYLTTGSGAGLRAVGRSPWTAYSASRLGFGAIEIYPDDLVIRGIGPNGEIFDQGVIARS